VIEGNREALRNLEWIYLKLLVAESHLRSNVSGEDERQLRERIGLLEADLKKQPESQSLRESKSSTLEILKKRYGGHANVAIVPVAVSDQIGRQTINITDDALAFSTFSQKWVDALEDEKSNRWGIAVKTSTDVVETSTLDALISEGYVRKLPDDPFTKSSSTWQTVPAEPDPNNPTAAVATREFFGKVVDFARRHQIIVCHDAMYSELRFDGYRPPSFLETPGAMEVGVEFHSLSKTYSMTGWRIGFSVGNAGAIAGLGKIKTNVDSGVFQAVQEAGIAALTGPQELAEQYRRTYQERRDVVVAGLKRLGWEVDVPKAAFFVWAPVPGGLDSRTFAARMLNEVGCVITPGVGFGPSGEGFYRIALTIDAKRLEEAMDRLRGLKL